MVKSYNKSTNINACELWVRGNGRGSSLQEGSSHTYTRNLG